MLRAALPLLLLLPALLPPRVQGAFYTEEDLTVGKPPDVAFYKVIGADTFGGTAAHVVHGDGTYDGGSIGCGTYNKVGHPEGDVLGSINQNGFVVKANAAGEMVWFYGNPVIGYYGSLLSCVEGPATDNYAIYAVGVVWTGADYDRYIVKLDAATGQEIWKATFPEPTVPGREGPQGALEFVDMDASGNLFVSGFVNGDVDMPIGEFKSGGKPERCHAFAGKMPASAVQKSTPPSASDFEWTAYQWPADKSAVSGSSIRALPDGGAVMLTRILEIPSVFRLSSTGAVTWTTNLPKNTQGAALAVSSDATFYAVSGLIFLENAAIDGAFSRINSDGTLAWTTHYGHPTMPLVGEECWGVQMVKDSLGEGIIAACGMGVELFKCPEDASTWTAEQKAACDGFTTLWRNFNLRLSPTDGSRIWSRVDAYMSDEGVRENGATVRLLLSRSLNSAH